MLITLVCAATPSFAKVKRNNGPYRILVLQGEFWIVGSHSQLQTSGAQPLDLPLAGPAE